MFKMHWAYPSDAMSCLLEKTQSAMKKDQELSSELKEEINAVNSNAQQQMRLCLT